MGDTPQSFEVFPYHDCYIYLCSIDPLLEDVLAWVLVDLTFGDGGQGIERLKDDR